MPADKYLSFSQMSSFLRCRQLWDYEYRQRLQPSLKHRAPELGDAVHRCIAAHLRGEDFINGWTSWKESFFKRSGRSHLLEEEEEIIDTMYEDCIATSLRAIRFIAESGLKTVVWDGIPMIEQRRSFPLPGWKGFVAVFDWVAQDQDRGFVWINDFKVRRDFQTEFSEEVSLQSGIYQAVAMLTGKEVTGSRTMQVKAGQMAKPKLNKDGTMSRADIRTDWPTYVESLGEAGLNPVDYLEMRDKLDAKEWQNWLTAYRGPTEVFNLWNGTVLPLAREMNRKSVIVTRNMNFINCMNCNQKDLCLADLRGHQWSTVPAEDEQTEISQGVLRWRNTLRK